MESIDLMQRPDVWPQTFVLPLVRRSAVPGEFPQSGFLFQGSLRTPCPPPKPIVYLDNIWRPGAIQGAAIGTVATQEYASLEAILADGWEID